MTPETALGVVAWTAGGLMVLALLPDASWLGLAAAVITAAAVVLARWWRPAATVGVQIAVVGFAVDGTTAGLATVAGLAATLFLLATHLAAVPALLRSVFRVMVPAIGGFALVALAAATVPTGPGWLAALAPLLVVGLYAGILLADRSITPHHTITPHRTITPRRAKS